MSYFFRESLIIKAVLIITLLLAAAPVLGSGPALAQQAESQVYPVQVKAGENGLAVDIMADNVANLYGAEFRVKYDPAVLAVEDVMTDQAGIQIEPGRLLPADQGFVVANQVNPADGTITFALTLLRPAVPVNGSGPLARITFNRLQEGPVTINVDHAKLVAINPQEPAGMPQTLASTTAALTLAESGSREAAPAAAPAASPPADGGFPWWIVAAAILVLGIIALAGFVVMGGLRKFEPLTPAPALPADPPAGRPVSSRPSAFKEPSRPAEPPLRSQR